jgi:NAD/NADP transhydrogenase beta subunit
MSTQHKKPQVDDRARKGAAAAGTDQKQVKSGFADLLFYMDRTMMAFGDAKKTVETIVKAIE